MQFYKPQAEAVLWMDDGVLLDNGQHGAVKPRLLDRMEEAAAFLSGEGIKMAVVTRSAVDEVRGTLFRAGLLKHLDSPMAVFSERDHKDNHINKALTHAFMAARESLGTPMGKTLAIVPGYKEVELARFAGLPVIGFAGASSVSFDRVDDLRREMTFRGAFYATSAAIDLPRIVMHFRPHHNENKWHPVAAPGSGR